MENWFSSLDSYVLIFFNWTKSFLRRLLMFQIFDMNEMDDEIQNSSVDPLIPQTSISSSADENSDGSDSVPPNFSKDEGQFQPGVWSY
ncbi:hypothetical protein AYI68_g8041 [Smittium mucronatum]|uniref:Uncharacterized protein n=1 Tax=Smittium mucronatum TaxID=133383 RepID=A0A1R0GM20_9FUNG|nr:hypothetical protein AYI68_g8041 [Smittium mucronatum]